MGSQLQPARLPVLAAVCCSSAKTHMQAAIAAQLEPVAALTSLPLLVHRKRAEEQGVALLTTPSRWPADWPRYQAWNPRLCCIPFNVNRKKAGKGADNAKHAALKMLSARPHSRKEVRACHRLLLITKTSSWQSWRPLSFWLLSVRAPKRRRIQALPHPCGAQAFDLLPAPLTSP